jgi:DNA polymerase III alpha subunit
MWIEKNSQEQIIQGIIRHGPSILENCLCSDDVSEYHSKIDLENLNYPKIPKTIDKDFWFIPKEYKDLDIENWLLNQSPDIVHYNRIEEELDLYRKNNMIPVLRAMKYIVDTLRKNNIVWGVGRGSSVASYALYLIGVHKIDSVKYKLPIEEFFKGEQNG